MSWDSEMTALNPSSWWKFAGNGNDEQGVANLTDQGSAVYVNSLVPSQNGAASNAVQLDGTADYFSDGDNYDFDAAFGTEKFTIAFWLKLESANFATNSQRIISKRVAGTPFEGWALHGSAGDNLSLLFDYGATEETWVGDLSLTNGGTYFIVAVWDSAIPEYRVYVDGISAAFDVTFTNSGANPNTTANLEVGAERGGNNKLQATLDELAVWDDVVLSAAQIRTLWNAGQHIPVRSQHLDYDYSR